MLAVAPVPILILIVVSKPGPRIYPPASASTASVKGLKTFPSFVLVAIEEFRYLNPVLAFKVSI